MSIRGRVDVYCTHSESTFIAVASSDEKDESGRPVRVEIVEFMATDPLYKATRIGDFGEFEFRAMELHKEIWSFEEAQEVWGQNSESESDWFDDDGWGAFEGPKPGYSDVEPRDQVVDFRPGLISRSARLLARVIRKLQRTRPKANEHSDRQFESAVEDNYIEPFEQLFSNDRSEYSPYTTWSLKQWLVDITVAAIDASPWSVAGWAEFNPIPTILVPISATASSVRFEILGLPFYEYTVERATDDHYDVRLVFTGNGRDETVI